MLSDLAAPPETVWERVASLEGINHELAPWLRMTAPRGTSLRPDAVPVGERWFRSWILLLGVLPFDYDDLRIERLEPGECFLERSTMLSARTWMHERTLEPRGPGTRLRDRVAFDSRVAVTALPHRRIITAIFMHRHRRLRRYFGVLNTI